MNHYEVSIPPTPLSPLAAVLFVWLAFMAVLFVAAVLVELEALIRWMVRHVRR